MLAVGAAVCLWPLQVEARPGEPPVGACSRALASLVAASGWSVARAANGGALEASPPPPQLSSGFFGNFGCCFKVCSFYKTICAVIFSWRIDLPEENNSEMQASYPCLLLHFRGHLNYSRRSTKQSHNHFLKLLTSPAAGSPACQHEAPPNFIICNVHSPEALCLRIASAVL